MSEMALQMVSTTIRTIPIYHSGPRLLWFWLFQIFYITAITIMIIILMFVEVLIENILTVGFGCLSTVEVIRSFSILFLVYLRIVCHWNDGLMMMFFIILLQLMHNWLRLTLLMVMLLVMSFVFITRGRWCKDLHMAHRIHNIEHHTSSTFMRRSNVCRTLKELVISCIVIFFAFRIIWRYQQRLLLSIMSRYTATDCILFTLKVKRWLPSGVTLLVEQSNEFESTAFLLIFHDYESPFS